MPPRRRKAAAKKQESPKKKARKSKEQNHGKKIEELYKQTAAEEIRNNQGAVSTIVWPYLTSDDNEEYWKEACHLWALFVAESPQAVLEECRQTDLWARIWETILNDVELSAPIVHAAIQVLANDDFNTSKEALLSHLTGVQLWHFIPERIRELELRKSAALRRKLSGTSKPKELWVVTWIDTLLGLLEKANAEDEGLSQDEWLLLTRSLELLIDLLSSSVTREHLIPYLEAIHFVVRCKLLSNKKKSDSQNHRLVQQLLARIQKLVQFPIRGQHTAMSKADVVSMYHERATILQKLCHRHYPDQLPEVIYAGVGLLCNGSYLKRAMMGALTDEQVWDIVRRMRIVGDEEDKDKGRDYWMEVLLHHVTIPPFEELSSFPLYPTERVLWNPSVIPPGRFAPESSAVLSLPKLQTQFLSYRDYLLRNFELSRLESAYEIRSDIVNVLRRVQPVVVRREDILGEELIETEFRGWARMALELPERIRVVKVDPPKLGQGHPSQVIAEVTIDLEKCGPSIRAEWDSLSEFDNLFLIGVDASQMSGEPAPLVEGTERPVPDEEDSSFPERYGIMVVRGCMVLHVRDEDGKILSDPSARGAPRESSSTKRILRVALDPAQYAMDGRSKLGTKIYDVSASYASELPVHIKLIVTSPRPI